MLFLDNAAPDSCCAERPLHIPTYPRLVSTAATVREKTWEQTVVTPTVKSREFYLQDDVTLFSKWPTFGKKNRGVKFLLAASFNER